MRKEKLINKIMEGMIKKKVIMIMMNKMLTMKNEMKINMITQILCKKKKMIKKTKLRWVLHLIKTKIYIVIIKKINLLMNDI